MIVLDTSALVRWLLQPGELTPAALRLIDQPGRRVISSISIWEIALKVKQGRIELPGTLQELVSRLEQLREFEVIPVDTRMWINSVELEWHHRDPADRVIVALAASYDCPLVSSDKLIGAFYPKTVW